MNCVSYDICVYHFWFLCFFFLGVFFHSRVTGTCPVTTDLIRRVNVRITTTTTPHNVIYSINIMVTAKKKQKKNSTLVV